VTGGRDAAGGQARSLVAVAGADVEARVVGQQLVQPAADGVVVLFDRVDAEAHVHDHGQTVALAEVHGMLEGFLHGLGARGAAAQSVVAELAGDEPGTGRDTVETILAAHVVPGGNAGAVGAVGAGVMVELDRGGVETTEPVLVVAHGNRPGHHRAAVGNVGALQGEDVPGHVIVA